MKKESLFIRILRGYKTDSEGYPIAGLEGSPVRYSSTYRRNQPGFDNLNYALAYDIQVTKDLLMGHQSGRLSVDRYSEGISREQRFKAIEKIYSCMPG